MKLVLHVCLSLCKQLWVTLFINRYFFRLFVCCIHCLYLYTYLNLIQWDKLLREETEIIYLKVIALFLSLAFFGSWVGTEQFFKRIIFSLIAICTFFFQAFSDMEIAMFLSLVSFGLCGNKVGSIFCRSTNDINDIYKFFKNSPWKSISRD